MAQHDATKWRNFQKRRGQCAAACGHLWSRPHCSALQLKIWLNNNLHLELSFVREKMLKFCLSKSWPCPGVCRCERQHWNASNELQRYKSLAATVQNLNRAINKNQNHRTNVVTATKDFRFSEKKTLSKHTTRTTRIERNLAAIVLWILTFNYQNRIKKQVEVL